eukprot:scaffold1070_cov245-Pinguiococcus_pyrenoidosus.AAC.18
MDRTHITFQRRNKWFGPRSHLRGALRCSFRRCFVLWGRTASSSAPERTLRGSQVLALAPKR